MSDETPTLPTLYTNAGQVAATEIESAAVLMEKADEYAVTIVTGDQASMTAEFRARLNELVKQMDKARLKSTEGYREMQARLNSDFKTKWIDPLTVKLASVDDALLAWAKKMKKQREEEAAALAEAERVAAEEARVAEEEKATQLGLEAPPPLPVELEPAQVAPIKAPPMQGSFGSTAGVREVWKWEEVDINLVPEEWLMPREVNRGKVTGAVKSLKGGCVIPGIRVYEEETIGSRVAK